LAQKLAVRGPQAKNIFFQNQHKILEISEFFQIFLIFYHHEGHICENPRKKVKAEDTFLNYHHGLDFLTALTALTV
jgi:hypothetical protein